MKNKICFSGLVEAMAAHAGAFEDYEVIKERPPQTPFGCIDAVFLKMSVSIQTFGGGYFYELMRPIAKLHNHPFHLA